MIDDIAADAEEIASRFSPEDRAFIEALHRYAVSCREAYDRDRRKRRGHRRPRGNKQFWAR